MSDWTPEKDRDPVERILETVERLIPARPEGPEMLGGPPVFHVEHPSITLHFDRGTVTIPLSELSTDLRERLLAVASAEVVGSWIRHTHPEPASSPPRSSA